MQAKISKECDDAMGLSDLENVLRSLATPAALKGIVD